MRIAPDETQRLTRDAAREFAQKILVPKAAQIDAEASIPKDILVALADLGLLGVNVPSQYGGAEAGAVSYALAMMEVAAGCASTSVTMAVTNMVAEVICMFGSEAQKQHYVQGLTSGKLVAGSFGLSEPEAGSDPGSMRTTATLEGEHWVINGTKQWITSGDFAGVFIVWARTAGPERPGTRGISCFLVPKDAPGLIIGQHEEKMGLRGSSTTGLIFENCRVPKDALLGELNMGFRIAMAALDGGRIGIASQAIGIARAAQQAAVSYAKERRTFGKPIGEHQGVQWMIADSATELEAAELLTLRAASTKEAKGNFSMQAAMAKVYATEAAGKICDRALQIHGGNGYTKDYAVERHYRDVRVTRIYEGTSEIQRIVIGRGLLS